MPISASHEAIALFDADSPATLAFARSLGARGVPVDVFATQWLTLASCSRYRRRVRRCPPLEDAGRFLPWLEQRVARSEISLIAPTSDLVVYYLARIYERLPPLQRALLGSADLLLDLVFKDRFYERCRTIAQHTPRTYLPTSLAEVMTLADTLTFPVIVKPRSHVGIGGTRGIVVRDREALCRHFAPYPLSPHADGIVAQHPHLCWPMIQAYVRGALDNLYAVSGVVDMNGEVVAVSACRKLDQWPRDLGIGMRFAPCNEQRLIDEGTALVAKLGYRGIFELELIYERAPDRYSVIDFNPRSFGQIALDIARGHDLPWLWYQLACGEAVAPSHAVRDDIQWTHAWPFHFGALVEITCGPHRRARLARYRDSLRERRVDVIHAAHDVAPTLAFAAKMMRHPGSLVRPFMRR